MSDPVKLTVDDSFHTPSDRLVLGEKRLVRLLPVPIPGTKQIVMKPAIWISPYSFFDSDVGDNVKIAILLFTPGPPKPDIIAVRIPANAIEKFPLGPIEW